MIELAWPWMGTVAILPVLVARLAPPAPRSAGAALRVPFFELTRDNAGSHRGAGRVAVLAVAIHENTHHSEHHDHISAFRTALHGHSHQGTPEHDHEPVAPSAAGKTRVVVQPLSLACSTQGAAECESIPVPCTDDEVGCAKEHEPPPYLILGVFLT